MPDPTQVDGVRRRELWVLPTDLQRGDIVMLGDGSAALGAMVDRFDPPYAMTVHDTPIARLDCGKELRVRRVVSKEEVARTEPAPRPCPQCGVDLRGPACLCVGGFF